MRYYITLLISNLLVEKPWIQLNNKIVSILLNEAGNNIVFENRVIIILLKTIGNNDGKLI